VPAVSSLGDCPTPAHQALRGWIVARTRAGVGQSLTKTVACAPEQVARNPTPEPDASGVSCQGVRHTGIWRGTNQEPVAWMNPAKQEGFKVYAVLRGRVEIVRGVQCYCKLAITKLINRRII